MALSSSRNTCLGDCIPPGNARRTAWRVVCSGRMKSFDSFSNGPVLLEALLRLPKIQWRERFLVRTRPAVGPTPVFQNFS